jgi:hypothetical protein
MKKSSERCGPGIDALPGLEKNMKLMKNLSKYFACLYFFSKSCYNESED